ADTPNPGMAISTALPTMTPRLAPSGGELFALQDGGAGAYSVVKATRSGSGWTPFMPVQVTGTVVDSGFAPGVPTLTTPRHMFVQAPSGIFLELSEDAPDMWNQVGGYNTTDLHVNSMQAPMLSSDGRNLIFAGTIVSPGGGPQIIVVTRADYA